MPLIRFLIISIALLYIVRSIAKMLLPMLFEKVVNKAQQNNQQQYQRPQNNADGRIRIDHIPEEARKGKIPDSEGEFVDYEEIK